VKPHRNVARVCGSTRWNRSPTLFDGLVVRYGRLMTCGVHVTVDGPPRDADTVAAAAAMLFLARMVRCMV